jgi:hypothetical protein
VRRARVWVCVLKCELDSASARAVNNTPQNRDAFFARVDRSRREKVGNQAAAERHGAGGRRCRRIAPVERVGNHEAVAAVAIGAQVFDLSAMQWDRVIVGLFLFGRRVGGVCIRHDERGAS